MKEKNIVDELRPLFLPESVAVIGATNNFNKWGFSTFASLKDKFKGKLYPVNHRDEQVLSIKAYKKITDIPGNVDLAVFVVPP